MREKYDIKNLDYAIDLNQGKQTLSKKHSLGFSTLFKLEFSALLSLFLFWCYISFFFFTLVLYSVNYRIIGRLYTSGEAADSREQTQLIKFARVW